MTEITIGVDVSKDTLDVHLHPDGTHRQFINDAAGFRLILDWIGSQPVARLVFEASGAYHRAFERAMGEAGIALCKVNPARARRFAEATGQSAKTDRIDAGWPGWVPFWSRTRAQRLPKQRVISRSCT